MNKANHKAIGKYCYGGKFYAGDCACGREHYLTAEQLKELSENSYFTVAHPGVLRKIYSVFL